MVSPISLVILGVVAVVIVAGTFGLLMVGKPVPEPVWVAWGVIVTALFGHGTFLAQSAAHAKNMSDVLDAVQAGATAAGPVVPTAIHLEPTTTAKTGTTTEEGK